MNWDQLQLQMIPRLAYAPDNFVRHAGVRALCEGVLSCFSASSFALCYVNGQPRSGKTHLAIYLVDQLVQAGFHPRFFDGAEILGRSDVCGFSSTDIVVIDSAQRMFNELQPGCSGPFVQLVESLRVVSGGVLCLSALETCDLPCDEHIQSRLQAGHFFSLQNPDQSDLPGIISAMAAQRGLYLSEKKLSFLGTRLPREIAVIEKVLDQLLYMTNTLGTPVRFETLHDALGSMQHDI